MPAPALYGAYLALEAAILWIGRTFLTRQVAGVVATGVVAEQAIIAAKKTKDVFDAEEKKACVICGTPSLEPPPIKSGPTPFPAGSQDLPNRTEYPNNGPVGVSDTGGGQESVDTGPTIYTTPNDGPAGATVVNVDTKFEDKIEKKMGNRGWDKDDVNNTIENPDRTVQTKDTRWNADGTRRDDPATAYIDEDGHYVVRNDIDGTIVQISNKNKDGWKSPFE